MLLALFTRESAEKKREKKFEFKVEYNVSVCKKLSAIKNILQAKHLQSIGRRCERILEDEITLPMEIYNV